MHEDNVTIYITYTLKDRSGGKATVEMDGTWDLPGGGAMCSLTGEMIIDEDTGWTDRADARMVASGMERGRSVRVEVTIRMRTD